MDLKDKVALVTGASRGIGKAIALELASRGATVVGTATTEAGAQAVTAMLAPHGGRGVVLNVTDVPACDALVETLTKQSGGLHILVNNAGIVADAQIKNMTDEQFDRVIAVNLKGVFNCTKAVVDTMLAQKSGVILNSSSIVGLYGNFGQSNYAAAKFGVIGMAKTWARELGRKGIRSNAVCPGFVSTSILATIPEKVIKALEDKVPMGRLGRPEDIANTFAFLASDDASYINGAVIEVSGGLVI